MSTQISETVFIPLLKCMYCGNEWIPRSTKKPKVCPKCKRYGWETGQTKKKKKHRGGANVNKGNTPHLGPATKEFLERMSKET
jgi:hypothetical protein